MLWIAAIVIIGGALFLWFAPGTKSVDTENNDDFIASRFKEAEACGILSTLEFNEGLAPIKQNGKWGFININGDIEIEPKFDYVDSFSEGLCCVKVDNEYVFIDNKGNIQIRLQADKCLGFHNGLAFIIYDEDKCGYINKEGNLILTFDEYVIDGWNFSEGLAPIYRNGEYVYIDKDGIEASEKTFDRAGSFSEGLAPIRVNNKYGFINNLFEISISPQFKEVKGFSEDLAAFKEDSNWGFINKKDEVIIKPQFGEVCSFNESLAAVYEDIDSPSILAGYINKSGEYIIKPVFTLAGSFYNGRALVYKDTDLLLINKSGNVIKNISQALR